MCLLGQTVLMCVYLYYAFGQHLEQLDLKSAVDWKPPHYFTEYCESFYSLLK